MRTMLYNSPYTNDSHTEVAYIRSVGFEALGETDLNENKKEKCTLVCNLKES